MNNAELFEKILDTLPQLIWINGADGMNVIYYNQRWYDYIGLSKEETIGLKWKNIVHPDDAERVYNSMTEAVSKQTDYEVEVRLLRGYGQYRWFLSRCVPLRDENKQIVNWVGTSTDINDSKAKMSDLQKTYEDLIAERRAKLKALTKELEELDV